MSDIFVYFVHFVVVPLTGHSMSKNNSYDLCSRVMAEIHQ